MWAALTGGAAGALSGALTQLFLRGPVAAPVGGAAAPGLPLEPGAPPPPLPPADKPKAGPSAPSSPEAAPVAPPPATALPVLARAELVPKAGTPGAMKRIAELGTRMRKMWPEVTGQAEMPKQALELAIAQAGLETSYGGGWLDKSGKEVNGKPQGDMRNSGNLGARQCGHYDKGGATWKCVPYGDSQPMPDGTQKPIDADFRFYIAGEGRDAAENGTIDFLRSLTKTWNVKEQLEKGDALEYAWRLYKLGYFGGFNVPRKELDRIQPTIKWLLAKGVPEKKLVSPEQVAGRIASYALAIGRRLPEVAAGLGHDRVYSYAPADLLASSAKGHASV